MLSLFKRGYYLKDIIPDAYVDIHNHILPGIDDGAKTLEQTSRLIYGMKKLNIQKAVVTPHTFAQYWNNTPRTIKKAYNEAVKMEMNDAFITGYASEYMLDMTLMERIDKENLLCIKDRYVLIELPLLSRPLNLFEMLFELKCKNYKVILAHPERYLYFHQNIKKIKKLKTFGVYFQLNLMSLIGNYGKAVQKNAKYLLNNDLYDFTGTDIHHQQHIDKLLSKKFRCNKNKLKSLLLKNEIFNI